MNFSYPCHTARTTFNKEDNGFLHVKLYKGIMILRDVLHYLHEYVTHHNKLWENVERLKLFLIK